MDLLQQPEASVSLLQIFIFFTVCLHPCICFHCAQRMTLLPLLNTTIHYLKWQVLLQDAVTCLRFWADQNLTGFLLISLFCVFPPTGNIILCFTFDLHIRPQWCLPTFLVSWKLPGGSTWPVPWSSACEYCGHAKVTAWSIEVQDLQLPISHAKRENIPEPSCTPTLDLVKVYPSPGWTWWNFLNFMSTDWSGNF